MFSRNPVNTTALIAIIIAIGTYIGYAFWEKSRLDEKEDSGYGPYVTVLIGFGFATVVYCILVGIKIKTETNIEEAVTKMVKTSFSREMTGLNSVASRIIALKGEMGAEKVGLNLSRFKLPEIKLNLGEQVENPFKQHPFNIASVAFAVVAVAIYIAYATWQHGLIKDEEKTHKGPYIMVMVVMGVLIVMMITVLIRKASIENEIVEKQPLDALRVIEEMKKARKQAAQRIRATYGSEGATIAGV